MKAIIYNAITIVENDYVERVESWISWVLSFGNDLMRIIMKEQFLPRDAL